MNHPNKGMRDMDPLSSIIRKQAVSEKAVFKLLTKEANNLTVPKTGSLDRKMSFQVHHF